MQSDDALLQKGREALASFAWREAFDSLTEADRSTPLSPEDLRGLGEAGWWVGDMAASVSAYERAHAGFVQAGQDGDAALATVALTRNNFQRGDGAVGMAWLKKGERLISEGEESKAAGNIIRMKGVIAFEGDHDEDTAIELGKRTVEIGTAIGDKSLMALGLHDQGRALISKGEVDAGFELIEEATLAAVSGDLPPMETAAIYCNTISSCAHLSDYGRAGEWSDVAKRWCERQAIAGFPGMCRVYRAEIMRLRGDWLAAETEARHACEELSGFNREYAAEAFYQLGEVRLRVGDLEGADDAFQRANGLGRPPHPGIALLRLAEGKVDGARSCIDRALTDDEAPLGRARALPVLIRIAVQQGRLDDARKAEAELVKIADTYKTDQFAAAVATARGEIALGSGDTARATAVLREAATLWRTMKMPYEEAHARLLLGRALIGEGDREAAELELRAAAAVFRDLGARLDLETVEQLLLSGGETRRATRTFVFTDIMRSTDLIAAVGDDAWHDLVTWHDQALRKLFAKHEGDEIDHAGDGFFIAFGDVSEAVACAIEIQRALAAHRKEHGFAPAVRIGLHSAEATEVEEGYRGQGVHEAARVGAAAEGGEILASRLTIDGIADDLTISEPRSLELKGIPGPVEVVAINWN